MNRKHMLFEAADTLLALSFFASIYGGGIGLLYVGHLFIGSPT